MNYWALEGSSNFRQRTVLAANMRNARRCEETAPHMRALYREASKANAVSRAPEAKTITPNAEENSTYGCVEWYLYPQANEGLASALKSFEQGR
jgi:hypothetical protein